MGSVAGATLPEDQMLLALEEVEQTEAGAAATARHIGGGARMRRGSGAQTAARCRHICRGSKQSVDIDDKACPCCKGLLHRIGEDVSERLDIVPAQFRVLVVRRPEIHLAAPARTWWFNRRRQRGSSKAVCRPRPLWQFCRRRCADESAALPSGSDLPGRGSISIAQRSPTGSAAPPGICDPFMNACSRISGRRPRSSPTRRQRRFSIPDEAAPRPASSGHTPETIDHGAGLILRRSPMSMRPTARPNSQSRILRGSRACCRSMAMPAIGRWPKKATSSLPSAGRMCAVASMNWRSAERCPK